MTPTREIYWNISGGILLYPFAAIAVALLAYGFYRRVRLWRLGRPEARADRPGTRLWGLVVEVLAHRRLLRDPYAGAAHLLIFYGFLVALVATALIAIQEWTGIRFLQGTFYLWYSLATDVAGILAIVGLAMALWRRAVRRPAHLPSVMDDWLALLLLLLIFLQGFLVEGLRIAATELEQQRDLARWSPGGYAVALALGRLDPAHLHAFHRFHWWLHALTAFAFIAYLGYGKLAHAAYGLLNVFFRSRDPSGRLTHVDIEAALEDESGSVERLGVERIDEYPWKGLLDLDACTNCGRCETVCPAHLSGVPLSPRKLIRDLRAHLTRVGPALLEARAAAAGSAGGPAAPDGLPRLFGEPGQAAPASAVLEEELWGCRTCGACQSACPVHIEHVPKLVDMRRHLVMTQSRMSDPVRQLLRNLEDRSHPWTGAQHDREAWLQGLDVKRLGGGDRAEYLFWVGCTGAMLDRNIAVTRALAKVLRSGGVDFAVLGAEESCTGDPARRVGDELTFQSLAKANIELLDGYGVRKIVTACPHCFNTFANEYPDFGGRYQVVHHTQLIRDLLRGGRLELTGRVSGLTYHDPCYLGRHNGVYQAPREILGALAAPGGFRELPRSGERALCCGSGGGYAWMDDDPRQRISHIRLEEVKASGAGSVAVSCPFCMQMFDDALRSLDPDRATRLVDVAELVAEALEE